LLAAIPRELWIGMAFIGGFWLTYRIYKHFVPNPTSQKVAPSLAELTRAAVPEPSPEKRRRALEVARRAQEGRAKVSSIPAVPQSVWRTDVDLPVETPPNCSPRPVTPPRQPDPPS